MPFPIARPTLTRTWHVGHPERAPADARIGVMMWHPDRSEVGWSCVEREGDGPSDGRWTGHRPGPRRDQHDPHARDRRDPTGQLRPPRDADEHGAARLHAV